MLMAEEWLKTWICLSFIFAWVRAARPRFDVSTDMGMVLVPADAEVDTAIFRLRATDQDTDFPLVFEIIATTSPIVRVENLPCTLYNKVCQANVILTRRLVAGRLHDFVVRVRDSKGDVNSMQATISVTNSTTPRDKIFPHLPSLIMVPEDTRPEKELDYLLVESNPWSGKPVYIELWQPKELFKIRQRQMGSQTKGIITLIGELDFETQSMYTLTMYATDPYTEPGKDTRNIAGLHVVVIVQDVQDVPPVFTLAPPLTKINNSIKSGDLILRVHAEDGDKGVPRDVTYGLISEGNPFTPFFNVSETTGEIILAKPLEELTKIIHVGAPIVLKIVAEEIRSMRDEPPAQATVVELGLLLGEPGNSPPHFENDNYIAWINENAEPGIIITFTDDYSTRVKDEDIGKAGVFALKLENNNGTFEVSPAVAERNANFVITVRDNTLIDYEKFRSLRFKIVAQEVGPATNLSTSAQVTIFLRDVNDNPPTFDNPLYDVTLTENPNAGTKVVQVHATDIDAGILGRIQYTKIIGDGSEAFDVNPDNGLVTVSMGSVLDREQTRRLDLIVEARDEDGRGLRGTSILTVNILDVNDNAPLFEKGIYEFLMNTELTNFTIPAFIKALDADAEPPNNLVQYEIVHGNYENKFHLNEETGELMIREAINKPRKVRQNYNRTLTLNMRKQFRKHIDTETLGIQINDTETINSTSELDFREFHPLPNLTREYLELQNQNRSRRAEDNPLFILAVRAYDLGVPHLSNLAQIRIMRPISAFARIVLFVMPGENPDPKKTAETLATITGSQVTIQEIKPYVSQANTGTSSDLGKRSIVVARVEQNGPGTLVDVDKIRASLTANGFGIISGMDNIGDNIAGPAAGENASAGNTGRNSSKNVSVVDSTDTDVTMYKAENKLLTWLLILLGLLLLAAVITLIICCICPSCPFFMEPRKRRVHSSETLVIHSDGRPKRHLHRKPIKVTDGYYGDRKEAWSADPERHHWQFNRRNTKNLGIASLPGDIVSGFRKSEHERLRRVASLSLRDDDNGDHAALDEQVLLVRSRVASLAPQNQHIYVEDVEAQNLNYEQAELDSLQKYELERGSDRIPGNEAMIPGHERSREQHFYRDGNAEVLRLITRGKIEDHKNFGDGTKELHRTNGKDILLQRFIEDQKLRRSQDLRESFQESFHETDVDRSMESHQRANEIAEIIILPERLELQRQPTYNQRQHQQEQMINADVQRLIVERNYKSKDFKDDEADEYRSRGILKASMRDAETGTGEVAKGVGNTSYAMHDVELVRQNALLTRLLLEKETRSLNVPMVDSSSFLETQSLPGHVAIATQTDRTAATQTEFFGRSRSDNEEFEEDHRIRRKSKLKERFETKEDFKKLKTIWVRTPIPEESRTQNGNKTSTPTRTKIEVTESCKVSISPDVLKEVSSSLKSSESGGNEEDEDEEVLVKREKVKADIMHKAHKLTSKEVSMSKKKVKEAKTDNDSTTASSEVKEKNTLMKSKFRKKTEKPSQVKKLEKVMKLEKSNFMEPSFRVLEREISNFHQKIRKFGDKKFKKIKRDNSKKEKECQLEGGTAYNVFEKCEVSVKKAKKSISRESSPTKITVEQRTKSSEGDSSTRDKKSTEQQKQNNSSLDIEDVDKLSGRSLNVNEIMTSTEEIQTASRSKLRREAHLGNSDTRSDGEKIEKSEESESKTDKLKESTSSLEMKIDSTSSSSKDFGKQQKQIENQKILTTQTQEKSSMRGQKLTMKLRPSGVVDMKRKVPSLEPKNLEDSRRRISKRDEKLVINKTLARDDGKSISPLRSKISGYHKKPTASEDQKSNQETKSSVIKESTTIDLDKLVEEVRDAVGKKISSFTQATKEAQNIKETERTITDNTEKILRSPLKLMLAQKVEPTTDKKHQEMSILQSVERDKVLKSMEGKDIKEKAKDLMEKSKLINSTSPIKLKSDDEISFIVIEKSKIISNLPESPNELQNKRSNTIEKSKGHLNQGDERLQSKENSVTNKNEAKILSIKSKELCEKTDETEKIISEEVDNKERIINDKVDETRKNIPHKTDESIKPVSDGISEELKIISDRSHDRNENVTGKVEEIKKNISDKIDDTKRMMTDKVDEIKKQKSKKIEETKIEKFDESKNVVSGGVDETMKMVSNKTDETKKPMSNKNKEVNKNLTNITIHETERTVRNEIDNNEKIVANEADEIKTESTRETNEEKTTNQVDGTTKIASDKIVNAKEIITDNINETEKIASEDIDKTEKLITDEVDETKKIVSHESDVPKINTRNKMDEVEKFSSDTVDEIKQTLTHEILKTKTTVTDKIDKTEKKISDNINGIEKSIAHMADETKKIMPDKMSATKENISDNICKDEKMTFDKNEQSEMKTDEDIPRSNPKQMSLKIKDELFPIVNTKNSETDLKLETDDSAIIKTIDSTIDIPVKTIRNNEEIAKEIENKKLTQDLFKSKFECLPNEMKSPKNEKRNYGNDDETSENIIHKDMKEISSEINDESLPAFNTENVDINKETPEKDNMNTKPMMRQEKPCEKKSVTTLNGSWKENEIAEAAEMKQPIEDRIQKDSPDNEDSVSPRNSNKDKEVSSTETSRLKEMKESEMQQRQETDEKEFSSRNASNKTRETSVESSQFKQVQGQINTAEVASVEDANNEKFLSGIEKDKANLDPSSQLDDSKKAILELTNAVDSIKIDGEESDNDSSSATDISNKTALRMKPYGTPRHSISSDETGDTSTPRHGKTLSGVKSSGRPRQKWSSEREKDSPLQVAVQQPGDSPTTGFPQNSEMTPADKPKISANKTTSDQKKKVQKSPAKEIHAASKLLKSIENTESKMSNNKQHPNAPRMRPMIVAVKRKDNSQKISPKREKGNRIEDKKSQRQNQSEVRNRSSVDQRKAEIRARHLKLHVSHRSLQSKDDYGAIEERRNGDFPSFPSPMGEVKDEGASRIIDHGKVPEIANARSRYMAWYQQKHAETERKRRERKEVDEEQPRPRWLKPKPGDRPRKAKSAEDADQREDVIKLSSGRRSRERAKSSSDAGHSLTPSLGRSSLSRARIRPLVNVESEQLKAIVRQGRRLRKVEGTKEEEPGVQIFIPEKPPRSQIDALSSTIQIEPRHYLTQHSEYKYEKDVPVMPFYLHPPPVPCPSTELVQDDSSENRRLDDDLDSGIAVSMQGGTRLRHQQLLEKKSVFDIAYSEAAPTQLRSDSSTPPT